MGVGVFKHKLQCLNNYDPNGFALMYLLYSEICFPDARKEHLLKMTRTYADM